MRIARVLGGGIVVSLPAAYLALTLWTNQVHHAIWIALALGLPAWGWLAGRALAQSLTLTADTVVIRNIFTTERVPLADVTEVGFYRGKLVVTSQHGTFAPERTIVGTAILGSSYFLAAAVVFGFGVYLGPVQGMQFHRHSFAVGEAGAVMYAGGISALAFAYRLTRDHRRKRQPPR